MSKRKSAEPSSVPFAVVVLSCGLAGCHYEYQGRWGKTSVSGCSGLEDFLAGLAASGGVLAHPSATCTFVGAFVLDKREPLERSAAWAVWSPMFDPALAPWEASRWGAKREERDASKLGAFEYAGLALYVDWWRRAGARVGRVMAGGAVEWEPVNPSPPASPRPDATAST